MVDQQFFSRIRNCLESTYGERLKGVVLFGSEARKESKPDSDIDSMVLLDGPIRTQKEIQTIVDSLYPLQLKIPNRPIHATPVDAKLFDAQDYHLFCTVKKEGIFL
jgi:uncharacterized protein